LTINAKRVYPAIEKNGSASALIIGNHGARTEESAVPVMTGVAASCAEEKGMVAVPSAPTLVPPPGCSISH
jgi:hypothetical protein